VDFGERVEEEEYFLYLFSNIGCWMSFLIELHSLKRSLFCHFEQTNFETKKSCKRAEDAKVGDVVVEVWYNLHFVLRLEAAR
jgi:hypothetical protein